MPLSFGCIYLLQVVVYVHQIFNCELISFSKSIKDDTLCSIISTAVKRFNGRFTENDFNCSHLETDAY